VSVGQSGSITVAAWSSGAVTNFSFSFDAPDGLVGNVTVQSLQPNIVVAQDSPGANHSRIMLETTDGSALPGGQPLIQINFDTLPNQITTATALRASAISAWLSCGQNVPTAPDASSMLNLVGADSMLQMQVANGQPSLTLYAPAGNYQLQSTSTPADPGSWTNEISATMTNLSQSFTNLSSTGVTMKFYRASRM
jgi:hypothetical protein